MCSESVHLGSFHTEIVGGLPEGTRLQSLLSPSCRLVILVGSTLLCVRGLVALHTAALIVIMTSVNVS